MRPRVRLAMYVYKCGLPVCLPASMAQPASFHLPMLLTHHHDNNIS